MGSGPARQGRRKVRRFGFARHGPKGNAPLEHSSTKPWNTIERGWIMASKYDGLARIIIQNVGGKENVKSVAHCVTRLRFKLKDESKANDEVLQQTDGVLQIMHAGGQYQIVIGPHVTDVYDTVLRIGNFQAGGLVDEDGNPIDDDEEEGGSKNPLDVAIDLVSGILQPTLGVLASSGMFKGILTLLVMAGVVTADDGAYKIWYAFADGFFYFLPIALGFTAAKKFKMSEFVGVCIGMALCYPQMTGITSGEVLGTVLNGTPFEMSYYTTFFGIPVIMPASGYTSSVIPIILACAAASKLEKGLKSFMPDAIAFFMVPMLTLVVMVPLTYIIIGPIATIITNALAWIFTTVQSIPVVGGAFYGALVGALWQVLVIFGMHWALVPLSLANLGSAATGYTDNILPPNFPCTFAQITVCFVMFLKTKDVNLKKVALPAMITGLFGTTEPAIYGVTLPKRIPFVISCVASAIGSAWIGMNGVRSFTSGYSGIMGFPRYVDPSGDVSNIINMTIGVVVAMVIAFVVTWIYYKDDPKTQKAAA